ncbi:hypothetical protein ACJJTC_011550 [Scirpophaga incertulas]
MSEEEAEELISRLQVVEVVCAKVSRGAWALVSGSGALACCAAARSPYTALRHMAARALAALADRDSAVVVHAIVNQVPKVDVATPHRAAAHGGARAGRAGRPGQRRRRARHRQPVILFRYQLVPALSDVRSDHARCGAAEALARTVDRLQLRAVPYAVLLVVPLLGRMSDHCGAVRTMATRCFASLIQLMPLDGAVPEPAGLSPEMRARRLSDRRFLEKLFNPKSIEDYKIPVPIATELRSYQQVHFDYFCDFISVIPSIFRLASTGFVFLNEYALHGVLCDDMGLGKTLQSIVVVASSHWERARDRAPALPSLVVCPPTLTGHWVFEVNKFIPNKFLKPLQYVGPPAERERLRSLVKRHNLIVASYDIVRKDIEFFSSVRWNYCVLDEGHVIKNGKTKAFKAIKQLIANHRLILSGTPIQNDVLELWSLFDFLMPGLLGTERQFTARYSRPILAARDPRATPHQLQAGALACEALHRQVLPFLLRRVKEDVLKELPPKITQDYYCELSPLQRLLYEHFSKDHMPKEITSHTHVFQALHYLQNVCNHPKLVLTPEHPEAARVAHMLAAQGSSLDDIQHSAKLLALKQLLVDCGIGCVGGGEAGAVGAAGARRALVFCQLQRTLDIVERDLLRRHLPRVHYLRLDGSLPPPRRHRLVQRFNADVSIDLLLLTTKVSLQRRRLHRPAAAHHQGVFCQLQRTLDIVERDLLRRHLPRVHYLRLDGSLPPPRRHRLVQRFNADVSIDLLLLTTKVCSASCNARWTSWSATCCGATCRACTTCGWTAACRRRAATASCSASTPTSPSTCCCSPPRCVLPAATHAGHRGARPAAAPPAARALPAAGRQPAAAAPPPPRAALQRRRLHRPAAAHHQGVFCQLQRTLDIVERDLLRRHLPRVHYLRLDGSLPPPRRHRLVQRFNADVSIDLLLLTTKVCSASCNARWTSWSATCCGATCRACTTCGWTAACRRRAATASCSASTPTSPSTCCCSPPRCVLPAAAHAGHRGARPAAAPPAARALPAAGRQPAAAAPPPPRAALQRRRLHRPAAAHHQGVFCQLQRTLDIVERDLLRRHLPRVHYLRLDGSLPPPRRHRLVQRFNADVSIDLLLLTTKVCSASCNARWTSWSATCCGATCRACTTCGWTAACRRRAATASCSASTPTSPSTCCCSPPRCVLPAATHAGHRGARPAAAPPAARALPAAGRQPAAAAPPPPRAALQRRRLHRPAAAHHQGVFCQLQRTLDIVERDLLRRHLPRVHYLRLDGSLPPPRRHRLVQRFNADVSIDLLLLTTKVCSASCNARWTSWSATCCGATCRACTTCGWTAACRRRAATASCSASTPTSPSTCCCSPPRCVLPAAAHAGHRGARPAAAPPAARALPAAGRQPAAAAPPPPRAALQRRRLHRPAAAHHQGVFCQLQRTLDIVERDLLRRHLPRVHYLRLDGSLPPPRRHRLVQRFNADVSIDLLLLTTKVGGLGLNLTGADTVIFVEHDWNPMKDLQAMDRAHRIGQKKVVNVYRLITRDTLEEKIMGLQKFKLMTANTVISSENAAMETMGTDQLLELFPGASPIAPVPTCEMEQYGDEYDMDAYVRRLTAADSSDRADDAHHTDSVDYCAIASHYSNVAPTGSADHTDVGSRANVYVQQLAAADGTDHADYIHHIDTVSRVELVDRAVPLNNYYSRNITVAADNTSTPNGDCAFDLTAVANCAATSKHNECNVTAKRTVAANRSGIANYASGSPSTDDDATSDEIDISSNDIAI